MRPTAHLILTAAQYFGEGPSKRAAPFSRRCCLLRGVDYFFAAGEKQMVSI